MLNKASVKTPLLALTVGEPAGIGPDLAVHLAQNKTPVPCVMIADPDVLLARAELQKLPVKIKTITPNQTIDQQLHYTGKGQLLCLPIKIKEKVIPGKLNVANAAYVLECIKTAVDLCMNGFFDALITGPIHKGIINQAGLTFSGLDSSGKATAEHAFTGHTEYLAQLSHTPRVIMMLATAGLRVALVTTHLPLKEVSQTITKKLLGEIITLLQQELKVKFSIENPKIAICGLNPHAGEDGHMGREEIDTIIPVIQKFQKQGMLLTGPVPADTIFTEKYLSQNDVILAMYHDQGLPVLKYKGFGQAVNITLGLPFVRTSVDHGTALDLAGSKNINSGSMFYAIKTALDMLN
ncbi:MAG: 4-hydroxythreonine-4-phosphate dehydrogenase PdxA [Pseudomonadota bacterium]